jgi:hypothetical protein
MGAPAALKPVPPAALPCTYFYDSTWTLPPSM